MSRIRVVFVSAKVLYSGELSTYQNGEAASWSKRMITRILPKP